MEEVQTVLRFFARFLDADRPDVLLTYGGDPVTQGMIGVAKRAGHPRRVRNSQLRVHATPALFARRSLHCAVAVRARHYRDRLGLDCQALPNPVDWERVRVENPDPRYVTFVNPAL